MLLKKIAGMHANTLSKIVMVLMASLIIAIILGLFILNRDPVDKPLDDAAYRDYPQFTSSVDADGDGIDDQTDILNNAKEYLATDPEYRAENFTCGYPDNNTGVCSDVIAWSLRNAGYDLMELINADVEADKDAYHIAVPDKNNDFRRVENQRTYLERHAISLTTDVKDTQAWQGGDIVVFKTHIGIVSDKRNTDGQPYVLSLAQDQKEHEENILDIKKGDIVGHFRISE